jgi:hypothetical protein
MPNIIASNGGPLLMLERNLLPYWGGIDNIGGVTNQHRHGVPFEGNSDYDRACKIRDWAAPLQVDDRAGIVFWGDHLGFGLVRESATAFFAVRPYCNVENLDDHINLVVKDEGVFRKDFEILISDNSAIVFDSASPGLEIIGDCLGIAILPGLYEVSTYEYKDPAAEAVFHKFHWCRGAR